MKPKKPTTTTESGIASLTIERLPIDDLKPHEKNPRKHPAEDSKEWEVLQKSIDHDYFDPVVFNRRNKKLVSGHFRVKVLRKMGVKLVDAVMVDYSEQEHVARMIAANKQVGTDDLFALKAAFESLAEAGDFDMSLTGFTDAEFAPFFAQAEGESDGPPAEFPSHDETIETKHTCPSCGYKYS